MKRIEGNEANNFVVLTSFLVIWYFLIAGFAKIGPNTAQAQLGLCLQNCKDADRLTGPTRMTATRDHPWKVAPFPAKNSGFCELGCQLFYTEVPKNTTCKVRP